MPLSARYDYNLPVDIVANSHLSARRVRKPTVHVIVPRQVNVAIVGSIVDFTAQATATKSEGSEVTTKSLTEAPFTKLFGRIKSLSKLKDGWNSYGAAAPNRQSRFWARRVLHELSNINLTPSTVSASSDEGIAIFFRAANRRASIECLNSGEILGVLSEGSNAPKVMSLSQDRLKHEVDKIQAFLTTI